MCCSLKTKTEKKKFSFIVLVIKYNKDKLEIEKINHEYKSPYRIALTCFVFMEYSFG